MEGFTGLALESAGIEVDELLLIPLIKLESEVVLISYIKPILMN
jgi:hypothetical protein